MSSVEVAIDRTVHVQELRFLHGVPLWVEAGLDSLWPVQAIVQCGNKNTTEHKLTCCGDKVRQVLSQF
jgi:lipoate-protein ligase B